MTNSARVLDASTIDEYRNTGGFTMLASGRDKIEKPEEFKMAADTARARGVGGHLELLGLLDLVAPAREHREAAGVAVLVDGARVEHARRVGHHALRPAEEAVQRR